MTSSLNNLYEPVVEVTRGAIAESVHYGAFCIVDPSGGLLASCGDPGLVTFLRSSAKPFQILPFIELNGDQEFGLTDREIAILCASHSGTDEHVAVLRSIQAKTGVTEADLKCGVHPAMDDATEKAMLLRGEQPSPNRHNCSGKHTGMLAYARLLGTSLEDYLDPRHLIQVKILETFAEMCDLTPDQVILGIDGCSAPVFAVPMHSAALGFARLGDPSQLSPQRAAACRRIVAAMTAHPDMVAGPRRFDTRLMEVVGDRAVTKSGAEGYQGIGLIPGAFGPGSPAVGITIKIADGDLNGRARSTLAFEILRQLGVLSPADQEALANFGPKPVRNWRKIEVGVLRPQITVQLEARSSIGVQGQE